MNKTITDKNKTILFTDPASLEEDGYYSSTGDVDDVACILFMSQKLGDNLTVVICDDDELGQRYSSFRKLIGDNLINNYKITIIKEVEFSIEDRIDIHNNIHIHAPILDSTAQILIDNIDNIQHVYTQGDDKAVNFKNSETSKNFIKMFSARASAHEIMAAKVLADSRNDPYPLPVSEGNATLTRYDTTETSFTLSYDPGLQETFPEVSKIYNQYFEFQQRKSFGTALHLDFLCNRLYSDTGFNDGPGNGIKAYKYLIEQLKEEGNLPALRGKLLDAFNKTTSHGGCDETAIENGKDLISLMNLYCDYETLIVDNKLPNMGNLGEIIKRTEVDERVSVLFDIVPNFTSTPLFDFAAAYFAISGKVEKNILIKAVIESLTELNEQLSSSRTSGGKRTKNNKKSKKTQNNKRKNKKSKKTQNNKRKNKKYTNKR